MHDSRKSAVKCQLISLAELHSAAILSFRETNVATVRLKRAYEKPSPEDGARVLVDRLWPRGVSKAGAAIDWWAKEIAPSPELRKWFGHEPARWQEFRRRYRREIDDHVEELDRLRDLVRRGTVTLVYAARDEERNDAVVLRDLLVSDVQPPN